MSSLLTPQTQIILKFWKGTATEQEIAALQQWLEKSPENRRFLEQFQDPKWVGRQTKAFAEIDVSAALEKLKRRIRANSGRM